MCTQVPGGESNFARSARRRARGEAYREGSAGWSIKGGQYKEECVKREGQGGED
jgi:hypothetical protein